MSDKSELGENEYFAYVDKTDWDYHFPDDWNGIRIYFSEKSIKEHNKCTKDCGFVKVRVTLEEVVDKGVPFHKRGITSAEEE